jgi:hypothetical protein
MDERDGSRGRWLVHAAAAVFLLLVVGLATGRIDLRDTEPDREGISGSGPRASDALGGDSPRPSQSVMATESDVATARVVLDVDFDDVPMGSGIGEAWQVAGGDGTVDVDAIPTAVNRSARLETMDGEAITACITLDPSIETLERLSVVVRLDGPSARASIQLIGPTGEPPLEVSLAGPASVVVAGSRARAEGAGLVAEAWYAAEVVPEDDAGAAAVWAIDGADGPVLDRPLAIQGPIDASEVCLAVAGEPGDAANFDDLTITGS